MFCHIQQQTCSVLKKIHSCPTIVLYYNTFEFFATGGPFWLLAQKCKTIGLSMSNFCVKKCKLMFCHNNNKDVLCWKKYTHVLQSSYITIISNSLWASCSEIIIKKIPYIISKLSNLILFSMWSSNEPKK